MSSLASYLDQFLEPVFDAFTPDCARRLVDLRVDEKTASRIDVLRHKAEEGKLTSAEENEYKDFVEAVDVISVMQAKAKRFLAKHS